MEDVTGCGASESKAWIGHPFQKPGNTYLEAQLGLRPAKHFEARNPCQDSCSLPAGWIKLAANEEKLLVSRGHRGQYHPFAWL